MLWGFWFFNTGSEVAKEYGPPTNDGHRILAEGEGLAAETDNGRRVGIEIRGTHIQVWVDGAIMELRTAACRRDTHALSGGGVWRGGGKREAQSMRAERNIRMARVATAPRVMARPVRPGMKKV